MKPEKITVYQLFEAQRRYLVPLFQRPYVWDRENHWEPLWEDIERKARDAAQELREQPHFLGAVVLNQLRRTARQVDSSEIIDGQQCLTTLQIFLAAYHSVVSDVKDERLLREIKRLTINDRLTDDLEEQFKVWPSKADQAPFERVMVRAGLVDEDEDAEGRNLQNGTSKLEQAFDFFQGKFRETLEDIDDELDAEWGALERDTKLWAFFDALRELLQMVTIDLDDSDDPQIIFETLNARGVPLLPSDLIRNFVLYSARQRGEDMQQLYDRYWSEFDERRTEKDKDDEDRYWKQNVRQGRLFRPRLDLFYFHFLQYRLGREIRISHLFQEFRVWWKDSSPATTKEGLEPLKQSSKVFERIVNPSDPKGDRMDLFLDRLGLMDTTTVHPLLLFVMDPECPVDKKAMAQIAIDLESFLIRRLICRLTTKNYNKLFFALLKTLRLGGDLAEIVRTRLLASEEDTYRWPSNDEVTVSWRTKRAYGQIRRDRIVMILRAIEAQMLTGKQEALSIDSDLTVEHVMPQNWTQNWSLSGPRGEMVGDSGETMEIRRERMLQTFGNLTLLTQPLNSSVSNSAYHVKRSEITKQSTLRLNAYFQDVDIWDEDAITARGQSLADVALTVWPKPPPARGGAG